MIKIVEYSKYMTFFDIGIFWYDIIKNKKDGLPIVRLSCLCKITNVVWKKKILDFFFMSFSTSEDCQCPSILFRGIQRNFSPVNNCYLSSGAVAFEFDANKILVLSMIIVD